VVPNLLFHKLCLGMSCISLQMAKFTFSISNNNFILIAILDGAMVLSSKVLFNCYNCRLLSEPVALLLQNLINAMSYYMKPSQYNETLGEEKE